MGYIVDPKPQVQAQLERLRSEHEPRIQEAKDAVSVAATREDRDAAKRVLKERQGAYKQARRQAKAILRAPIRW